MIQRVHLQRDPSLRRDFDVWPGLSCILLAALAPVGALERDIAYLRELAERERGRLGGDAAQVEEHAGAERTVDDAERPARGERKISFGCFDGQSHSQVGWGHTSARQTLQLPMEDKAR